MMLGTTNIKFTNICHCLPQTEELLIVPVPPPPFWLHRGMLQQKETSLTSNLSPSRKEGGKHA